MTFIFRINFPIFSVPQICLHLVHTTKQVLRIIVCYYFQHFNCDTTIQTYNFRYLYPCLYPQYCRRYAQRVFSESIPSKHITNTHVCIQIYVSVPNINVYDARDEHMVLFMYSVDVLFNGILSFHHITHLTKAHPSLYIYFRREWEYLQIMH